MDTSIRQAASVLVGRDGSAGFELLVLERGAGSRFLPGYVAFPGGAVDPGDADLAAAWFGAPSEDARAAALRELVEEMGLALTRGGLVVAGEDDPLEPIHKEPPGTDQMPMVAHWIAPEQVPVRFDARFFAVAAPGDLEPSPDGEETAHAWWAPPPLLVEEWKSERRKLYWPTYFTVLQLARCRSVEDLLRLRFETREPDPDDVAALPRSVFWQE